MSNFIAIDLDSQGVYAVAGTTRGAVRITHALSWTGDDEDPPPPLTADTAKALGEKLRDKLRAAGVAPAPLLVAIGRDRVILKELKYPVVPPPEEPALVRFQAMKEMSEAPEEVVLDYAPLGDTASGERRSMAVVVRKEVFAAIQALSQAAGLKLAAVTPRPYATAAGLYRAFTSGVVAPPEEKGDAVASLTLSPAGGEFTVIRHGEVAFTLAIPAPVVATETMLVAQVRRNLAAYAGQHPKHPVQAVYVAEVDGPWVPRLRAALGVPVHAIDPLAGAVPATPDPLRGRFAGAVGMLAGRSTNALPINFASPRQPQIAKDPAKKMLMMVAVAAAVLLLGAGAFGFWMVNERETEVAELSQRRDELKDAISRGGPDTTRVKGIDGWTQREVVWLDELYDLADRMPADDSVRVMSLTATPIPPGKDGKSDGHSKVELRLAATNTPSANALMSAFVHDNPSTNRYYVGTSPVIGPLNGKSAGKHMQSFTIITRINHRDPGEYERNTRFAPRRKTAGGAAGGIAAIPSAALDMAPEPTPAP